MIWFFLVVISCLIIVLVVKDAKENKTTNNQTFYCPSSTTQKISSIDRSALLTNSLLVLEAVEKHNGATAQEIADITGLDIKQVNGIVTSAFQRKGYMARSEEYDPRTGMTVKRIYITQ